MIAVPRPRAASTTTHPVTVRRADPVAWKRALALVDGDGSRLELLSDGTVLVRNSPRR